MSSEMKIKVLGTGCAKCKKLYEQARQAITLAGIEAQLEKVESLDEIMTYGIMMTPALVINEEVKCSGKIPKSAQIVTWINEITYM